MLHVFLPWKVNYSESRFEQIRSRAERRRHLRGPVQHVVAGDVSHGCPSVSCPNLIEEVRVNGV
jgi:hypothetical protein